LQIVKKKKESSTKQNDKDDTPVGWSNFVMCGNIEVLFTAKVSRRKSDVRIAL